METEFCTLFLVINILMHEFQAINKKMCLKILPVIQSKHSLSLRYNGQENHFRKSSRLMLYRDVIEVHNKKIIQKN